MALSIKIDWDNDGTYAATYDDATPDVRSRISPVHLEYGRDQNTALAPMAAGRGGFVLDNRSRKYSPRNASSVLFGKIKPARNVLCTRSVGGTTYTLFRGHTDDNPLNPDLDNKTVAVSLVDGLADLQGQNISTELFSGIRTGDAITKVLDAVGWPAADRDIDPGATVIPWWWEDQTDALNAIEKIVQSEGSPSLVTIDPDGKLLFLDRHHRLLNARSITSQATFRGAESRQLPYLAVPFTYDEAWRNIINTGTVNVDVRAAEILQPVFTSESRIVLSPLEQKLITVTSDEPFFNAQIPVLDTDYTLIAGAVSFTLTRLSGASTTVVMTGGAAGAQIEALQLRAQPVKVQNAVQVSAQDVQSVADFGPRSFPTEIPWCNPGDADAVLEAAVALRSQPLPILTATFVVPEIYPDMAAAVLSRDISDRVTIYENDTSLNGVDFYIESITHDFTDELDHRVTFGLEMVPQAQTSPMFRFDTSGQGFDQGRFSTGIEDPTLVFQFDSNVSGHRFDEGQFAN